MSERSGSLQVVVAGMHRSGTSMTASSLQALGINMGDRLARADIHNAKGYFEDWDFVEFHRDVFLALCPADEPGWLEVGFTQSEAWATERLSAFTAKAEALVAHRAELPIWGWKDPRTTLLLPFWRERVPQARFVLVYRRPWDVVDSLFRVGHDVFDMHPEFALRIWMRYNRSLLDFYRAHRASCVLVNTNRIQQAWPAFARLLTDKLELPLDPGAAETVLASSYDESLMRDLPHDHPVIPFYRQFHPEAMSLFEALDAAADLPSEPLRTTSTPSLGLAMLHRQAVQLPLATKTAETARQEAHAARQEAETARQEADVARRQVEAAQHEVEAARHQVEEAKALADGRQSTIDALRASTSWRLTAPLRSVVARVRRAEH